MRNICRTNDIPCLVERSRSGKGAHLWIFFDSPVSATQARKFGNLLLEVGALSVNLKSFRYYDRMLPAQDEIPKGGLGNLIALPLQGRALLNNNSAFVDDNWEVYYDQWRVLRETRKLSHEEIEKCINVWIAEITSSDEKSIESDKPWERRREFVRTDVSGVMDVTVADQLYVYTGNIAIRLQNQIRRLAAFANPQFYKNKAMGLSNYANSRFIYLGYDDGDYTCIPRGLLDELERKCKEAAIDYRINDQRSEGRKINVSFTGELRMNQNVAVNRLMQFDNGILSAATAFGKTVVCTNLIAEKKTSTLIVLESSALIEQWQNAIERLHSVPDDETLVLIGTGQLIGEGFDYPRLDTLVMATPVAGKGVVEQYAGRLYRDYNNKKEVVIYDYIDFNIPVFDRMYAKRLQAYKRIGYKIAGTIEPHKHDANAIYDYETYYEVFRNDLLEAKANIVVSSPMLSRAVVIDFIKLMRDKQESGIRITVITISNDRVVRDKYAHRDEIIELISKAGISIEYSRGNCMHCSVIDDDIVWYGSMNLLSKVTEEDNIMRLKSSEIAAELLEITYRV